MRKKLFFFYILFFTLSAFSQDAFKVVALGCGGGPLDNNLTAYLIASKDSQNFIALDAGTILGGIQIAKEKNSFQEIAIDPHSDLNFDGEIFLNSIKCFLISHAHLDHVASLVINSPWEGEKTIYGIDSTIDMIRDHLFNWEIWPNYGSEGKKPHLNLYTYHRLKPNQRISIPDTAMTVESFVLNHPNSYFSTAFLIEYSEDYVLYFGDTSPDALESKKRLKKVWEKIVPLIQQNRLHGIFLECSYTNQQQDANLCGHLNPKHLMEEMHNLARLVDPTQSQTSLKNLKIIVTHIKDTYLKGPSAKQIVEQELNELNDLGLQLVFLEQGQKFTL